MPPDRNERRPDPHRGGAHGELGGSTKARIAADYVTLLQRRLLLAVDDSRTAAAYRRGYATGYEAGWLDAIASIKTTDRELVTALDRAATRWVVRGQRRTRQTFADPHPRDYPGLMP